MQARALQLTAVVIAATMGLAGCASAAASQYRTATAANAADALAIAQQRGFEWEVSILEDGEISSRDYEQAYDRYMECQRELGYVFDKPKYLDPVEGQRWQAVSVYRGSGEPPMDELNACYDKIFIIEDPFALSTPMRMDPLLLAAFRECLDGNGIPYRGDEVNFNDFMLDVGDEEYRNLNPESSHAACLVDTAFDLYPDLISVGFGR